MLKLELARLYQNNAEFDDALKYYNEVLVGDKTNPVALYNVAVIKTQMGKYTDANLIYNALLKVDEEVLANNEIAISDIQKDLYENQIKFGQSLIESGEAKKAKSVFNKLLDNNQEDYRIYLGLADSSFALGMNTYAKNYYEQALTLDGSNLDIVARYAQVLYELKDYETALALLDKITDENPNDDKAYYNKGLINFQLKEYETAVKDIFKAIEIDPTKADSYYLLGSVFEAYEKPQDAIYAFEKFIEFSTDETLKEKIKAKTKNLYDGVVKKW